jgi:hypothetical protein
LNGSKNYKLNLPSDMPASNFWSVIVYDIQTQLIIQSGQAWPSVHSNGKNLVLSSDGSVDIWFGPKASEGKENNWVQTIPSKAWYLVLRIYDVSVPLANQAWRPGKIICLD